MGDQSAGKSSVLESLVGIDLLPRGNDMVTRCPLILQLRRLKYDPATEQKPEEYATFTHLPDKIFKDFLEVRKEIEARTDELAPGLTVNNTKISLTVHSPDVIDLTLMDLPGMT